jgi:hypothetical protein
MGVTLAIEERIQKFSLQCENRYDASLSPTETMCHFGSSRPHESALTR